MKIIYILIACILLASCQKEDNLPVDTSRKGPFLTVVKAVSNGEKIIQNEFQYNPDGSVKSALIYKDYKIGLVGSKRIYQYQDGRLKIVLAEMDYSSSSSSVTYSFSKTEFEYNSDNTIIQSNNFRKENNEYKFASFFTYTYNDRKLPIKISRYVADGSLFGYSTYAYDGNNNVVTEENYGIDQSGSPVKQSQQNYQYDNQNNPYRNTSDLASAIPYSISKNNVTITTSIYYTANPQGVTNTFTTKYNAYNSSGYPTSMDSQGNIFELEYK